MPALLEKPTSRVPEVPTASPIYHTNGNGTASAHFKLPPESTPTPLAIFDEPYTLSLTRAMVATLKEAGHLDGLRYQHFNGRIVVYPMQSNFHKESVIALIAWLLDLFGRRFLQTYGGLALSGQDSDTGNPQPDITVSVSPTSSYTGTTIPVQVVRLAIEIAYTSLNADKGEKALLYARAGIADYWVLDIRGRRMLIHREPNEGEYQSVTAYEENEFVAPLASPEAAIQVAELLPPVTE